MDYADAYNRARYSASQSDLRRLLAEARQNPHDETLHGAVADAVDELHPDHPVATLIREQFGLTGGERRSNLWYEPVENSWDGSFPYAARLGKHGPFDVYLRHEGGPEQSQKWVVHAVSNQPGSRDTGYTFEFPHEEAHRIPRLFPAAAKYISPVEWSEDAAIPGSLGRAREAGRFNDAMDEEERNRN